MRGRERVVEIAERGDERAPRSSRVRRRCGRAPSAIEPLGGAQRARCPGLVSASRIDRRSPATASRSMKPRSTKPSTTAVIVGFATARRSASSDDRSSPAATRREHPVLRERQVAVAGGPLERSGRRARGPGRAARGRDPARPQGYRTVRGPNYLEPSRRGKMRPMTGGARHRRRDDQREGRAGRRRRHRWSSARSGRSRSSAGRRHRRAGRRARCGSSSSTPCARSPPRTRPKPPTSPRSAMCSQYSSIVPVDAHARAGRADADVAGPARHRPLASRSWRATKARS